jgi:hypothetical protein
MSIATLKRKSNTKYNNMSVGQNGFSLNGTHRNQGYIGQTSLSRSLSQTPMKDGTPKGSGGCCGTYLVTPIVQSAVKSTEDSSVVKKTVMNTSGMLSSRNRWAKRGAPFSSVKPDNNNNVNSQTDYITRLQKKVIADADSCYQTKTNCPKCTTTIPNMVRGSLPLMLLLFTFLQDYTPYINAAIITGIIVMTLSAIALFFMKETFARDLDFIEE